MTGLSYNLPINLRLATSAPDLGNVPPQVIAAFDEVYLVLNNLASAFVTLTGAGPINRSEWELRKNDPSTLLATNTHRLYVQADEVLAYGEIVSFTNSGTDLRAILADATNNSRFAVGFVNNVDGAGIGDVAEIIVGQGLLPSSGLTPGDPYYLSTTPGFMAAAPAVAAGNIEQFLGVAASPNALFFNCGYWIQH